MIKRRQPVLASRETQSRPHCDSWLKLNYLPSCLHYLAPTNYTKFKTLTHFYTYLAVETIPTGVRSGL